jgi:hypothetical protein
MAEIRFNEPSAFNFSALSHRHPYISNNRAKRKSAKFAGFYAKFVVFDNGTRVIMTQWKEKANYGVRMTRLAGEGK